MASFELQGRVAVVTGSTRGIGRACVEALAEQGAKVVVSSRSAEECAKVARQLQDQYGPGCALAVACDVEELDQIDHLISSTTQRWGRLDCLVAHAAPATDTTSWIEKIDEAEMARAVVANVTSVTRLVKRAVPIMRKCGGGSIIITSSVAGLVPMEDRLTYGVTKAALIHLSKVLAVQLGPHNIRVNSIAPGIIDTGPNGHGIWADPELRSAAVNRTPLQRTGTPDEVAGCVAWLASPSGAFTTGQVLVMDGGQMLKGADGVREMHDILRSRHRHARPGPSADITPA